MTRRITYCLSMVPPPSPFDRDTAMRWLREESDELLQTFRWALTYTSDRKTRGDLSILMCDVSAIMKAAVDIVATGSAKSPVRLEQSELDWPDHTTSLIRAVCSGHYDRQFGANPEPSHGFDVLALILRDRIAADRLKGSARKNAMRALSYPMAAEPDTAATGGAS